MIISFRLDLGEGRNSKTIQPSIRGLRLVEEVSVKKTFEDTYAHKFRQDKYGNEKIVKLSVRNQCLDSPISCRKKEGMFKLKIIRNTSFW